MKVIILENIRSAYNVGNILRTADALGREVWLSGYTPSPLEHPKVAKTSLGAEKTVPMRQFNFTQEAIQAAKEQGLYVVAAEITPEAIALENLQKKGSGFAVIFGNEVEGVLSETLKQVDDVVYIPMQGVKESLNVGQSTAIFMRAINQIK